MRENAAMKRVRHLQGPVIRLVMFALGAAASLAFAIFAAGAALGLAGSVRPLVAMALVSAFTSAALLLLTAGLLWRQGVGLSVLGLPLNRLRLHELAAGFVVSAALFLAVAAVQSFIVRAPWLFQGGRGLMAAIADLPLIVSLVLVEELLFRGFALRTLRALCGDRAAIALSAVAFGAYHVVGTHYWAMGAVFQFLMPVLGGLLFAWAAVRTGGLALPIGLHLGGNWVQASVAAFSPVSPAAAEPIHAVWRIPISAADVQALTAPDVLPRLPYMLAMAMAAVLTWQIIGRLERETLRTGLLR
jgi:membrane protease YdiL (CAAX protease family)